MFELKNTTGGVILAESDSDQTPQGLKLDKIRSCWVSEPVNRLRPEELQEKAFVPAMAFNGRLI
jgi:hypothetical protein